MAMLNLDRKKNGIQTGGPLDYCEICANNNNRIDYGELEYKECFKINHNGTNICLCMDHFKSTLGHYILLDQNELISELPEEELEEKKDKDNNSKNNSNEPAKNKNSKKNQKEK